MGLFWDLIQQSEIYDQQKKAETLEERVIFLENELRNTREIIDNLLKLLEEKFGHDLDGDGKVG
jgi:hypothetical protein